MGTTGRRSIRCLMAIAVVAMLCFFPAPALASPGAYSVLFVYGVSTGGCVDATLQNELAAQPGVASVTAFDANAATPSDATLDQYDMVVAISDCGGYADGATLGDHLADYADQGGVVVEYPFTMESSSDNEIQGRWLTGGYSPYVPGGNPDDNVTLGTFDASSPLMAGVSSLTSSGCDTSATLAPGATRVAQWNNAAEAIAYKGQAVAVNAGMDGSCTFSGDFARLTLNAVTWLGRHTLTVAKAGSGSGTVTSNLGGINCGPTCSANFNRGTAVTLTAAPAAGSTFTGWSGGGCSGTSTCTVTMNAAQSVTATFTLLPPTGTRIAKAKINRKKHRASFRFTASGTVTGFQCALVGPGHRKLKFASCKSPKTYKHLKHGRYKFEVRAVNSSGPDSKPAIKKFRI